MATVKLDRGFSYRNRPNGAYQLRVYDPTRQPKEVYVSLNTDNPVAASARATAYYRKYVAGTWDPWTGGMKYLSIEQVIASFKREKRHVMRVETLADQVGIFRHLMSISGVTKQDALTAITSEHIRLFIGRRTLSQASKFSYHGKIKSIFRWAVAKGIIESSPLDDVRAPRKPRILPDGLGSDELDRLVRAGIQHSEDCKQIYTAYENPTWAIDAFRFIASTGLRPSEAARLVWDDIIWPEGDMPGRILPRSRGGKRTKTDTERAVTMIPSAHRLLHDLDGRAECEYVLTNHTRRAPISVGYLSTRFRKFRTMAGLPDHYSLYSLRHTFAAEYRRRGGALHMLQHELGHASIATTQKYGHLGRDERMMHTLKLFENN